MHTQLEAQTILYTYINRLTCCRQQVLSQCQVCHVVRFFSRSLRLRNFLSNRYYLFLVVSVGGVEGGSFLLTENVGDLVCVVLRNTPPLVCAGPVGGGERCPLGALLASSDAVAHGELHWRSHWWSGESRRHRALPHVHQPGWVQNLSKAGQRWPPSYSER